MELPKDIYIIDPLGSSDADDAFSISFENGENILWIFIADPTSHFKIFDSTFNSIVEKCSTKYFYDKPPEHLFDESILSLSNLKTELDLVNCVCFKIYVDRIDKLEYEISMPKIKPNVILCYETAELNPFLEKALQISDALFARRNSYAKALRDNNIDFPKYVNGKWILKKDSLLCIKLKNMIAEFAIIVNKIVALELKDNIFRSCETSEDLLKCDNGREMLECIIKNGISAKYETKKNKHLLIDTELYTHFTSPLRRASDCITHFLLKHKMGGGECPFDLNWLENISSKFTEKFKKDKKRNYNDTKHFTLMALDNLQKPVKCHFKLISQFNEYTNLILYKANEFNLQMSVTLRNKPTKKEFVCEINQINFNERFDNKIFPELNSVE